MNSYARASLRLATAVSVELPAARIAFQFLRAMSAVPRIPQRQTDGIEVTPEVRGQGFRRCRGYQGLKPLAISCGPFGAATRSVGASSKAVVLSVASTEPHTNGPQRGHRK